MQIVANSCRNLQEQFTKIMVDYENSKLFIYVILTKQICFYKSDFHKQALEIIYLFILISGVQILPDCTLWVSHLLMEFLSTYWSLRIIQENMNYVSSTKWYHSTSIKFALLNFLILDIKVMLSGYTMHTKALVRIY